MMMDQLIEELLMFELDLNKSEQLFSLNLEKAGFDLSNLPKLQVRLAVDASGSMEDEYNNGLVEAMIDLFIPAGMKFDDNNSIDVGFFNNQFHKAVPATPSLFGKYMKRYGNLANGGTSFLPILTNMYEPESKPNLLDKLIGFLGFSKLNLNERVYLTIITDGDNRDKFDTREYLGKADKLSTYIQFIAIGDQVTHANLDALATRPNVHVIYYPDPTKITPEQLYTDICHTEFLNWTKQS